MLAFQHALLTAAIGILLWAAREGWYWRRRAGEEALPPPEREPGFPTCTTMLGDRTRVDAERQGYGAATSASDEGASHGNRRYARS